ncbi:MAG: sugar nucleotide-binding protein, partial [Flavobacteriaceae bacterium]|nr:sugar nucleotide-binding protein [Flavobacteriaceae bacterium]
NATGVDHLAMALQDKGIVLIHISTDYVFDGQNSRPYKTTDLTRPLNVYGRSKLKGEKYIEQRLSKYFIIRTSWLYSPYGHNFVKTVARRVKNGAKMTIDSSQTGSPTSAYDLADFVNYLIAGEIENYGVYHFTASDHATWFELAMFVARHYSEKPESLISSTARYETKAERPKYSVLDLQKTLKIYEDIPSWKVSVSTVIGKMNTMV